MTCCAAPRSRPTVFIATVLLSAVAFIGQAFTLPAIVDPSAVAVHAAAFAPLR